MKIIHLFNYTSFKGSLVKLFSNNNSTRSNAMQLSNTAQKRVSGLAVLALLLSIFSLTVVAPTAANAVPTTYSVTYNGNGSTGGSVPIDGASYGYDQSVSIAAAGDLAKTGYTLRGWSFSQNGSSYLTEGQTFNITDNTTLWAQWRINQYNCSVDSNGGDSNGNGTCGAGIDYDSSVTAPLAPSWTGHTFTYWDISTGGTVNAGSTFNMPASDTTLTAQWTTNTWQLTYDPGIASGDPISLEKEYGSSINRDSQFEAPTGYHFAGWNLSNTTMPDNDLTLVAQWDPNGHGCYVDQNNGSGASNGNCDDSAYYGKTITAPDAPSRNGYTFDSWSKSNGGSLNPGDTFTMPDFDVTLTAQWTAIVTNFRYHSGYTGMIHDDGDGNYNFDPCSNYYGDCNSVWYYDSYTYNENYSYETYYGSYGSHLSNIYRPGYQIIGWSTDPDALVPDSRFIGKWCGEGDYCFGGYQGWDGGNIDLYPIWSPLHISSATVHQWDNNSIPDLEGQWNAVEVKITGVEWNQARFVRDGTELYVCGFGDSFGGGCGSDGIWFLDDHTFIYWLPSYKMSSVISVTNPTNGDTSEFVFTWPIVANSLTPGTITLNGSSEQYVDFTVRGSGFAPEGSNLYYCEAPEGSSCVTIKLDGIAVTGNAGSYGELTFTLNVANLTPGTHTITLMRYPDAVEATITFQVISLQPVIRTISPAQGPTTGGKHIVVTGSNFVSGATVTVGGLAATEVVVAENGNEISFISPAGAVGNATVVVTNPNNESASTTYRYVAPQANIPSISFKVTSISPARGFTEGGTPITIRGTGFRPGTTVTIGGVPAGNVVVNENGREITAVTPGGVAAGNVNVIVTIPGGTSDVSQIAYTAPGNQEFNLDLGGDDDFREVSLPFPIKFNGLYYSSIFVGSNSYVTFGAGSTVYYDISGANPYLQKIMIDVRDNYSLNNAYFASTDASWVLRYEGRRLSGQGADIVWELSANVSDATTMVLKIKSVNTGEDAGVTGVYTEDLLIDLLGGAETAWTITSKDVTILSPINFEYVDPTPAAPTVSWITPNSGDIAGGNSITIYGTNLNNGTGITIDGRSATVTSADEGGSWITVTVPPAVEVVGPVILHVNTAGGSVTATYTYTYTPTPIAAPSIAFFNPTSGLLAGGNTMVIVGANLNREETAITIGGQAATISGRGDVFEGLDVLYVVVPTGVIPGSAVIAVTTAGGTAQATYNYTPTQVPSISGITPGFGPLTGGTQIVISGTNLPNPDELEVSMLMIGGIAADTVTAVLVDGKYEIHAFVPAHAAGSANVMLATPRGVANSYYTYAVPVVPVINNPTVYVTNTVPVPAPALSKPKVDALSSASGSTLGGYALTLTGADFSTAAKVTIGGVTAVITAQTATSITFTVPAHAAGPVNVIVTNADGGSATAAFNYEAPVVAISAPSVTSITPGSGYAKGGDTISITGSGFVAGASVQIGGSAATSVTVVSSSKITAVVPAGSVGTANVTVTNADGGKATGFYMYIAETAADSNPTAPVTTKDVTIGFKVSQFILTAAQKNAILAAGLKANVVVTVYGYASPTANKAADKALATSRANSVKQQILKLVPTANVTAIGKGSTYTSKCVATANRCAIVKVNQN